MAVVRLLLYTGKQSLCGGKTTKAVFVCCYTDLYGQKLNLLDMLQVSLLDCCCCCTLKFPLCLFVSIAQSTILCCVSVWLCGIVLFFYLMHIIEQSMLLMSCQYRPTIHFVLKVFEMYCGSLILSRVLFSNSFCLSEMIIGKENMCECRIYVFFCNRFQYFMR